MTKRIIISLLAIIAGILTQASAEDEAIDKSNYYISAFGGITARNNVKINMPQFGASLNDSTKIGVSAGLAVGYIFEQFRFEIEGSSRENRVMKSDMDLGDIFLFIILPFPFFLPEKGAVSYDSLILNCYYDIPLGYDFSLYIGAGAGISQETIKQTIRFQQGSTLSYESTRLVFAGQAMAGLSYAINQSWTIYTGYKFFFVPGHNIKDIHGPSATSKAKIKNAFIDNIELGVRYRF